MNLTEPEWDWLYKKVKSINGVSEVIEDIAMSSKILEEIRGRFNKPKEKTYEEYTKDFHEFTDNMCQLMIPGEKHDIWIWVQSHRYYSEYADRAYESMRIRIRLLGLVPHTVEYQGLFRLTEADQRIAAWYWGYPLEKEKKDD